MSDVVDWLRQEFPEDSGMAQVIDEITRLRAELAALRENSLAVLTRVRGYRDKVITERDALRAQLDEARDALEPFADMLMSYDAPKQGWMLSECRPEIGALRRARAVLDKIKGGGE